MLLEELELIDPSFREIWRVCHPYTSLSLECGYTLFQTVRYIVENNIQGDFVEGGVGHGGSAMIVMFTLQHLGVPTRRIWLFDQFSGATSLQTGDNDQNGDSLTSQATAEFAVVRANVSKLGYNSELVSFLQGDLRESVPRAALGAIALLHLHANSHDDAFAELNLLYPPLVEGGALLISGRDWHQERQEAVHDYFGTLKEKGFRKPLLEWIDTTSRLAVKPSRSPFTITQRRDYHSPTLKRSHLLQKFPSLVAGDPSLVKWPYLRSDAPHIWRTDTRSIRLSDTGVLSIEEAELLYNNALPFKGRRGIEIGCHYGWSSAHLVLAGLRLDIIDPALTYDDQRRDVEDSLSCLGHETDYVLWPAYSPSILPSISKVNGAPWSFAFIDGFHEGDAPRQDAEMAARFLDETACVMFHDMTSPYVAAGLGYLASVGWSTGIYNTMQIMGIAWRGHFIPASHCGDPGMPKINHPHLEHFAMLSD